MILAAPAFTQNTTFFDDFDDLNNWWVHVVPDSHNDEYQVGSSNFSHSNSIFSSSITLIEM